MTDPPRTEDLEALVRQFQASDLRELQVRAGSFQLYLSRDADTPPIWGTTASPSAPLPKTAPATAPAVHPATAVTTDTPTDLPEGMDIIHAPYLGHFYRAPKPGEPNFIELGDTVEVGADLCLVEVMKLFTAVRAETKGIVRHVYPADGEMVQEGQPLFAIEPTS